MKNTIVTNQKGRRIIFVGATVPGSQHDKKLADADAPPFPPGSQVPADSGYQGYTVEQVSIITPIKKPKGGELTEDEKALKCLSCHRVYRIEDDIPVMLIEEATIEPERKTKA